MMMPSATTTPLAIYVHWPFCKAKCPYCDFNSHVREGVDEKAWQEALLAELAHMAAWMPDYSVHSLFFGGGTPSLMSAQTVGAVLDAVADHWSLTRDVEITLEANPTSVEAGKFSAFKSAGINRVSLGVQSLRAEALHFLGREHDVREALAAVDLAASTFDRYSFDMIYARPGQSTGEWESELREALRHAGGHLSLYQLTIEENTAFHHAYHHKGAFSLPPEDEASELFVLTLDVMADAGLPAYEISNHARPGQESRHNLTYWRGDPYLGIGPGAHGRSIIDGQWHAVQTLKSPERWLQSVQRTGNGIELCEALDVRARAEEYAMMGLRLAEGLQLDKLQVHHYLNPRKLSMLTEQGFVQRRDGRLIATRAGWMLLNRMIGELLA